MDFFEPYDLKKIQLSSFSSINENDVITFQSDGWVKSFDSIPDTLRAVPACKKNFVDNQVSDKSINVLMQYVEKWHDEGVKVYGFRPPSTRHMEKLENRISGFDVELIKQKFADNGGSWKTGHRCREESPSTRHIRHRTVGKIATVPASAG